MGWWYLSGLGFFRFLKFWVLFTLFVSLHFLQILEPNKTDEFYHEAAKNGITIWQDFMFACSTYTNQTDFLDSVAQEVKSQLWRLVTG